MIILIEIMKDKWKSLSELDIVTGLDMGWCSELRLLVLHNSYLYCLYTATTTTKKKKSTNQGQTNKSLFRTRKRKHQSRKSWRHVCVDACWSIF